MSQERSAVQARHLSGLVWKTLLQSFPIRPSIGTVGDSFDNALAETVNGYYKSELIYGPARSGPWKTVADVELATLSWVHWHNTTRLRGYSTTYWQQSSKPRSTLRNGPTNPRSKSNSPSLHQNQGDSHRGARTNLIKTRATVSGCREHVL